MADEVELHSTKANTDPHRDHSRLFYFGIAAVAVAATEPLFHHRFNDDCRPRMEVCSAIDLMSLPDGKNKHPHGMPFGPMATSLSSDSGTATVSGVGLALANWGRQRG
jgi:hypothetical protein